MRLLFIRQPSNFFVPTLGNGMGIIATISSEAGHEVKVIDNNSHYKFYSDRELIKIAESYQPDLIAFSVNMLNAYFTYALLSKLKKRFTNIFYLGGGIHMKHSFKEGLTNGFDMVVNQEGEVVILPLLDYLKERSCEDFREGFENIAGISFIKKDGELHRANEFPRIESLDDVPFVNYDLFNLKDYFKTKKEPGVISICGQRGCPFRCTFCSDKYLRADKRISSADYMFRYTEYLYNEYKRKFIIINDNNFTFPRKRAVEFCKKVINSSLHKKVKFSIQTHVNTAYDDELLELMIEAGTVSFGFGLERMEPYSKKMINKNVSESKTFQTLDFLKKYNVTVSVNGILGFPFETEEILLKEKEAFLRLTKYTRNINFAILMPVPGTIYYDEYPKTKEWYLNDKIFSIWRSYFATVFESSKIVNIDQNFFDLNQNILKKLRKIFFEFKYIQHAYYLPHSFFSKLVVYLDKMIALVSKALFSIYPSLEFQVFRRVIYLRYFFGSLLFGDKVFKE